MSGDTAHFIGLMEDRLDKAMVRCKKAEALLIKEQARVAVLELQWKLIEGPGVDGHKVLLRELDPFDRFNRGDENRDAIAAGYWNEEHKFWVWPFGSTDHPPTHWAPLPPRLTKVK